MVLWCAVAVRRTLQSTSTVVVVTPLVAADEREFGGRKMVEFCVGQTGVAERVEIQPSRIVSTGLWEVNGNSGGAL